MCVDLCSRRRSRLNIAIQEFCRIPTPEDWSRFVRYARRVRTFKFATNPEEKALKLADSVFDDLARTRTTLEILPNLRCLWWTSASKSRHATLFMHDKVTEFAFQVCTDCPDNLQALNTDVIGRMPSLRSLTWGNTYGNHDKENDEALLQLLSSLPKLREVTAPKDVLNGVFLKTLSLLPELEVVQFFTEGISYPINPISSTPQEGAFPNLYDICLYSYLDDARQYLTGGALLPRLRYVSVESVVPESPLKVQQFFTDVTRSYPTLEVFLMDVIVSIDKQGDCEPLLPEHLRPILSLKQLIRLELCHNLPLQISEVDLAEFGAGLPALETLHLNPVPLLLTRPTLTLHSLLTIAKNFPKLFDLGIYLDAEDVTMPMPWPMPSSAKTRMFPFLRTLNVGVSPIARDHVPVALFLSHLFSENDGVVIQSGTTWNEVLFEGSIEYSNTIIKRCEKWDEVTKTLPLLLQLRNEEKAHRRDIEKEVEDLRMRNEVIMGKIRVNEGTKSAREAYENKCVIC